MPLTSKGAILIAKNNKHVDYVKQAVFAANRIKTYLNIPTTIITDSKNYLLNNFDSTVFDHIIPLKYEAETGNERLFFDGANTNKTANFKNSGRAKVYDVSPYDETLLLDTDYIISNDILKNCFTSANDFLIYKDASDLAQVRNEQEFKYISDTGVEFYWATAVFFRKTPTNKIYFNLVDHIEQEWTHYRRVYQIESSMFRNDYAFSIAIHIMNGFQQGNFANAMPGKMWYTTDKDILISIVKDSMTFMVEKEKSFGNYTAITSNNQTVHVMNKFSLGRVIDKGFKND